MSILDIILIGFTIILMIQAFFRKKHFNEIIFYLVIDLVLIFLHFIFDVTRWQVFILYGMPVFAISHALIDLIQIKKLRRTLHVVITIPIVFITIISIGLTYTLPLPKMDYTLGDYNIGTTLLNLKDTTRQESFGPKTGRREIRLQIWYPTETKDGLKALWFADGEDVLQAMTKSFGLKGFMLNHLLEVESNALINVPISENEVTYPVIVLSHGWASSRIFHMHYGEYLASNGYIVVGVDHTYGSTATRLKDGSVASIDESILPEEDFLDEGAVLIDVYKEDIAFVMNELSFLNETLSMINNKMDLNQIGLLGHSTGGAASGLYAMENDIQSLVLLDPWFKPVEAEPVDEPLLIICSDEWKEEDQYTDIKKMSPYIYALEDSRHQDFTLSYKLSPVLQWFNQTGKDSSELQMKMILNHFNVHLKQLQDEMIRDTRLNYIEISSY